MPYARHGSGSRRRQHKAARRGIQLVRQSIPTTMGSGSGRAQRAQKAQKALRAS